MQLLGPEGSTWLNVGPAITANGFTGFALVPGTYRVAITTATAVYATLTRPAPMLLKNAAASFISLVVDHVDTYTLPFDVSRR